MCITDTLEGRGAHDFQMNFQLPARIEEVVIAQNEGGGICRIQRLKGLEIRCSALVPVEIRKQSSEISRAYGQVCKAARLSVSGRGTLPTEIVTRIAWS
jgi:hypothetical protein